MQSKRFHDETQDKDIFEALYFGWRGLDQCKEDIIPMLRSYWLKFRKMRPSFIKQLESRK